MPIMILSRMDCNICRRRSEDGTLAVHRAVAALYSDETFVRTFAQAEERFAFLDDMRSLLEFSPLYVDVKRREGRLQAVSEHYLRLRPGVTFGSAVKHGDAIDVREVARQLHRYADLTEPLEDHLKLQMQTLEGELNDSVRMTLDAREAAIIGPAARMKSLLYDFLCVYRFKQSSAALVAAAMGGNEEAFFMLARIDKTIITTPLGIDWIRERQYRCDWNWFARLARELAKRPLPREPMLLKAIMLVAYFWDEKFAVVPYPGMVEFLRRRGVLAGRVPEEHFRKMLNRAGLKKPRHNRRNQDSRKNHVS
jgi:hypothetical protein